MKTLLALLTLVAAGLGAAETPRRIVSAAPSITEMLYAVGLGDRVIAVTEFCHYPPEVRGKPKIGSYLYPNLETITALRPDLVVTLEEHDDLRAKLERLKLPVLAVQHNDLPGIFKSMRKIGARAGAGEAAERRVAEIESNLAEIERRAAGWPRRKTMFIVGRTPGTIHDVVVAGAGSFLNDLIQTAGGVNIFAAAGGAYPRVPREEILARAPEVVIDMGDMSDTDQVTDAHRRSVPALWREALPALPAVRDGRVFAVADDIFVVPGPRIDQAATALFRMIHPEAAP